MFLLSKTRRNHVIILTILFLLDVLIVLFSPPERTLGENLGFIYLHGAWVWTGIITFSISALAGLGALVARNNPLHSLSRASGWSRMFFWITYLPMSLAVMKINWNGFFFDEHRWKIPFTFAVIGLLLQVGAYLINTHWFTSLTNLFFGSALLFNLINLDSVLHPESPVASSGSPGIKMVFTVLLLVTLLMSMVIMSNWLLSFSHKQFHPVKEE